MVFAPRTAIVTGSDSGIGRAAAVALAASGMDVGITWHTDEQGAKETSEEVRSMGRKAFTARLDTTDLPACGLVIDRLAAELGVTSVHETQPRVGSAAYTASKHGLGGLMKVMALELGRYGITVNSVAPGEIATPMTDQQDEDPHHADRPGIPLGRPGDAREIAAVVAFLASPAASYVTGASWPVDGGVLQMGPQGGSHIVSTDWLEG